MRAIRGAMTMLSLGDLREGNRAGAPLRIRQFGHTRPRPSGMAKFSQPLLELPQTAPDGRFRRPAFDAGPDFLETW
jgi:hypothetical protein